MIIINMTIRSVSSQNSDTQDFQMLLRLIKKINNPLSLAVVQVFTLLLQFLTKPTFLTIILNLLLRNDYNKSL